MGSNGGGRSVPLFAFVASCIWNQFHFPVNACRQEGSIGGASLFIGGRDAPSRAGPFEHRIAGLPIQPIYAPNPPIIGRMLTRYIHEAMKRARFKTLDDETWFGEIPGLAGVWANEATVNGCREVLQEVLEEWLTLKIRDNDPIPRLGRVGLSLKAA